MCFVNLIKNNINFIFMTLTLMNLVGIRKKYTTAEVISKASQIETALKKYKAVTAANSNGALNIWIKDKGGYSCESMRYCERIEKQDYTDIADVKKWATKWLKEIK